ncbi:MAG: DUF805 domain-containing protein [Burkholderiaceae bacterium]|nr:DUF805 domain-containing protein [Burkholderiaceae bacterium]
MSIFSWFAYCLKNYFTFSGRASRAQYWSFTLINVLVSFIIALISTPTTQVVTIEENGFYSTSMVEDFGIAFIIYSLLMIIPSFAVTVRRLHDRDHTGWWVFWAVLLPFLNIVLLVFCLLPSENRANRFGERAPTEPNDVVPSTQTTCVPLSQENKPNGQKEPSVLDEFSSNNHPTSLENTHKTVSPEKSSLVEHLKKLSQKE